MTDADRGPLGIRVDGPSPAMAVGLDLARRSLWVLPVALVLCYGFWGLAGVWSALYGLAVVVANFLLSAWMLAVTGRIGAAVMGAAALFGFLLRLGLVMVAVLAVRNAPWVSLIPLGLTVLVSHLVLLFWEVRHVSASLAFPGLAPRPGRNPHLPVRDADAVPSSESPSAASS